MCVPTRILHGAGTVHDYGADLVQVWADLDTLAAIRILTWLHYPDVSLKGVTLTDFFHDRVRVDEFTFFFESFFDVSLIF